MRILLDENFPLQLYRRLGEVGYEAEHIPQAIPITRRVELWEHAIDDFVQHPNPGRLFEVLGDGRVVAWDFRP